MPPVFPVPRIVPREAHDEVIEKLEQVLDEVKTGKIPASRVVIAFALRDAEHGGRSFFVASAGDFKSVADEVGLLHVAAYVRMTEELE
jgi:hypothetical protein